MVYLPGMKVRVRRDLPQLGLREADKGIISIMFHHSPQDYVVRFRPGDDQYVVPHDDLAPREPVFWAVLRWRWECKRRRNSPPNTLS